MRKHGVADACLNLLVVTIALCTIAWSQAPQGCKGLPDHNKLRTVLQSVVKQGHQQNGGMGNQEWAVVVDRDGIGCAVAFSGDNRSQEWPGSRMIAAEKANTANALSGPDYALSTANVYFPSQPGQSLYGLITTAPPNPQAAYGDPTSFGQENDPIVGKPVGGIVVFGGGLALYSAKGEIVGGLGLSGDTSCADHIMAWKVRHEVHLDAVPMGPSPGHNDNMILDIQNGVSASGFGHPVCKGGNPGGDIINIFQKTSPREERSKKRLTACQRGILNGPQKAFHRNHWRRWTHACGGRRGMGSPHATTFRELGAYCVRAHGGA